MLTNSLKISDTTKTEFFEPIFFQRNEKYDKNVAMKFYAVFLTL